MASPYLFTIFSIAAVGASLYFIRKYFEGGIFRSKMKLIGKTVIITGANTGIGKATALDLAKRGARVIIACRNDLRGKMAAMDIRQQSGNSDIEYKNLDLASLNSIHRFANDIIKNESQLNILINNAGIMSCPQWKTEDGFEMQFGVNHLGHFLLTNLLLDLLKRSAPSRIIVVSSALHKRGSINFDDLQGQKGYLPAKAYQQSKLANVLFAHELSKRLNNTGVTVNSLHPGVVRTELGRHFAIMRIPMMRILLSPIALLFLKSPTGGAQTSIYCAVAKELEGVSGKYFGDCREKACAVQGQDDEVARRLWDISCELVHIKD